MDININQYNEYSFNKKALLCAELCNLAYRGEIEPYIKTQLGVNNELIDRIANLKYKSIQYHVYETITHQFIVIRGTDTKFGYLEALSDLYVSFNFLPKKSDSGVFCHRGYSDVGNKIIEQINKKKLINKNKKLVVTGHSLGGAIAKYLSIHVKDVDLFTYGAPQISDKDYFVFNHNVNEYHFMNRHDWICSFPSTLYNDDKYVYVINKDCEVERKRIKRLGIFIPFVYLGFRTIVRNNTNILDDHALRTYIKRLKELTERKNDQII